MQNGEECDADSTCILYMIHVYTEATAASALWKTVYTRRKCAGVQGQYVHGKYAKLGSVVFYGNTLPNCNVQSVNHGRQQQEESSAL